MIFIHILRIKQKCLKLNAVNKLDEEVSSLWGNKVEVRQY